MSATLAWAKILLEDLSYAELEKLIFCECRNCNQTGYEPCGEIKCVECDGNGRFLTRFGGIIAKVVLFVNECKIKGNKVTCMVDKQGDTK